MSVLLRRSDEQVKGGKKNWTLYVLRLEENKWYVGITSQSVERRFSEHLNSRKTYWTEKYKPIDIADTKSLGNLNLEEVKEYENKVTRRYMKAKGINNVRGGNLTDKSDYIVRFGYIWDKLSWESVTLVAMQTSVIVYLFIACYTSKH